MDHNHSVRQVIHGNRCRAGFTLVELLVVIGIIGLLIAILLPAVAKAMEASRRTACLNNVKQIGLGLNLHLDSYKTLPPGSRLPLLRYHGFLFWKDVLPFMEEKRLAQLIDKVKTHPEGGSANNPGLRNFLSQIKIPWLSCPSSPFERLIFVEKAPSYGVPEDSYLQPTDYAGVSGSVKGHKVIEFGGTVRTDSGIFHNYVTDGTYDKWNRVLPGYRGREPGVRVREITDGLSHTMMIAEASGIMLDPDDPSRQLSGRTAGFFLEGCCCADWMPTCSTGMMTVRHPIGTNDISAPGTGNGGGIHQPIQSAHYGGGCVTMVDGSTHYLTDALEISTLYNLADRNDGNPVGNFTSSN